MSCLALVVVALAYSMARSVRAILIDLSGTLHVEDSAIPGAVEALTKLRSVGQFRVRFVTNTTKESRARLAQRLNKLGFNITENEMHTSLSVARKIVESKGLNPMMFLEKEAEEEFSFLNENEAKKNHDSVLIGLNPDKFDYSHLNQAFHLIRQGAPLIAIHKARYFKRKDGLALGPGPFVIGLEYATGVKAQVVGKPEASFFQQALDDLECSASESIMIGDDVRDDVGGAQTAGIRGILVKTGKYSKDDENRHGVQPYFVADSFVEAVDFILQETSPKATL